MFFVGLLYILAGIIVVKIRNDLDGSYSTIFNIVYFIFWPFNLMTITVDKVQTSLIEFLNRKFGE